MVKFDDSIGNAKAVVTYKPTGKWFMISGGWGNDYVSTLMMGAACGDVAGSVPQAIKAFLEGDSFADVISCAISIGGDSDTIAAIAGSIAEVIYPIPQGLRGRVIDLYTK